jgi:dsDNA-binding SOS-regulon protein
VTYDGKLKFGFHANAEVDELYDRSLDPGELKNLALDKRYVEIAREKREEIIAWLHETEHPYTPLFKRKKTKALS